MGRKEDILDVAQKLFSKHGFSNVSTKKLAAEAKCNEVTIFRLFGSKYGILEEITHKFVDETDVLKKLKEEFTGELERDIETTLKIYWDFLKKNEIIFRIQLKLSDVNLRKYVRSIDFKEICVQHFEKIFNRYDIGISSEEFIVHMLSSVIGAFLFYIQTEGSFTHLSNDEILESHIKFYKIMLPSFRPL